MNSLILKTATRYLLPLLVLYSIFLLQQGHHEPGGGFVGGLMAAAAIALCGLAYDVETARRILPGPPPRLIGIGLSLMVLSGLAGWTQGEAFLSGQWTKVSLPGDREIDLGSPLLFDVGVYVVVVGVTLMILWTLAED